MIVQQMSMRVPQTNTSKIGININSGILDKMKDKFRRNTLPELTSEECKNHIHVLD